MSRLTLEACEAWREKEYGPMALVKNPPNHSCDNLLLFTATMALYCECDLSFSQLLHYVLGVEIEPGRYARYPGEDTSTSWDDHLALAVASPVRAKHILGYGNANGWAWDGKWLGRFPIFKPTIRAAAGEDFGIIDTLSAAAAFLWDCTVDKQETSGRLLLVLAKRVLKDQNWFLSLCIRLWDEALSRKYPGGYAELYGIYFKPDADGTQHPFVTMWEKT